MAERPRSLPDGTYTVAVRTLYATLAPTWIMATAFLCVGAHAALETRDPLLTVLLVLGGIAVSARIGVLLRYRDEACDPAITVVRAQRVERFFAIPYLTFAATLGMFGARVFQEAGPELHMLMIGLLFGYAAGVAAGIFLRPWIALPSMAMAVVPTAIVALSSADLTYVAAGMLLLVFLAGGIQSLMRNYRAAAAEITARRTFATLARADALTGLENRLSLRESFDAALARVGRHGILAVHCLDLDRFKAVNDSHGHPAGDALLQSVADRLRRVLRAGDAAARFGGDEFVVLQVAAQHGGEADMLARRIARAIAEPHAVLDHQLNIGTSVGYALYPDHGHDLDQLIAHADEALIRVKREGGGIGRYSPDASPETRRLSA